MRLTCVICIINLIILGICGGVFAFSGFDLLRFACFDLPAAYLSFMAISGISALFLIYALIFLKPFKRLK